MPPLCEDKQHWKVEKQVHFTFTLNYLNIFTFAAIYCHTTLPYCTLIRQNLDPQHLGYRCIFRLITDINYAWLVGSHAQIN